MLNPNEQNNYEEFIEEVFDEDDDDSDSPDIETYDVYALQCLVDGFGNDTFTIALFKTYEDALEKYNDMLNRENYHEWQLKIVGQNFGDEYLI